MTHPIRFAIAGLLLLGVLAPTVWLCAADKPGTDKDKTPAPEKRESPTPDKKEDAGEVLLQTVGTLAGFQLYQSYLNIGFIADGKAEGTYTDKDVVQILDTVLVSLDRLDERLQKVAKLDVTKEDREAIEQIRVISAVLRQQGDELKQFWKSGKKENGDNYEKARQEAWQGISKLLKLEE